jgi:hypothetical protein
MDQFFSVLRAGTAPGSSLIERQSAATVCRLLLTALETPIGQPLAFPGGPTAPDASAPSAEVSTGEIMPGQSLPPDKADADAPTKAASLALVPDLAEAAAPVALDSASRAAEGPRVAPEATPQIPTASAPRTTLDPAAVAELVRAARNVPTDQLLELAIVRVQSLLKERGQVPPPPAPSALGFPIVPLSASLLAGKGGSHG